MYLLRFLQESSAPEDKTGEGSVKVEFRIACSGEFYNSNVITLDWRKSDIARVLLRTPIEVFVASIPFDSYPQELSVRLKLNFVTETTGSFSSTFLPDEDIVEDLCSLLSLLSRRLLSPMCKVRQDQDLPYPGASSLGSLGSEYPIPLMPLREVAAWKQRPVTVMTSINEQKVTFNAPPPVGVAPDVLSEFLLKLPSIPDASNIVLSARLYRTALELIESRADIAYLLLISTVESLAAVALEDYQPDESEQLQAQGAVAVQRRAKELGLESEKVKQLGLDACKGERWLKKKFKRFLLNFTDAEQLVKKDRVFLVPDYLDPPIEDFSKVLGRIYDARSVNLHRASPFPSSISIGTSPYMSTRQLTTNWLERPEIPPVAWFERVVSHAARSFLLSKLGMSDQPFRDLSQQT